MDQRARQLCLAWRRSTCDVAIPVRCEIASKVSIQNYLGMDYQKTDKAIHNSSGQGAAMAFEDAAVLGVLFASLKTKEQVPDILTIFEQVRQLRTLEVSRRSAAMRDVFAIPDGPKQQERDRQLREHKPFDGYANVLADPVLQKWLFGYDAIEEGTKAWHVFEKGEFPGTRGTWKTSSTV
jgi:hypothetical protein